jgi:hypothetical protein
MGLDGYTATSFLPAKKWRQIVANIAAMKSLDSLLVIMLLLPASPYFPNYDAAVLVFRLCHLSAQPVWCIRLAICNGERVRHKDWIKPCFHPLLLFFLVSMFTLTFDSSP